MAVTMGLTRSAARPGADRTCEMTAELDQRRPWRCVDGRVRTGPPAGKMAGKHGDGGLGGCAGVGFPQVVVVGGDGPVAWGWLLPGGPGVVGRGRAGMVWFVPVLVDPDGGDLVSTRCPARPVCPVLPVRVCVLSVVSVVAVLALVLAGCSPGRPQAEESFDPYEAAASYRASRTEGATASAESTPSMGVLSPEDQQLKDIAAAMPPPVRPPEMDENTQMGAIAAAVYFMKLYPYAYATGDLTQWQAMSEPECVFCASVVTNVTNLHAAGGWDDPWQVDIIEATYTDPAPGYTHAAIDLVYDIE